MLRIKDLLTDEVYNLSGATKEFTTKDSLIVDRVVSNVFKRNWHGVFSHYIYGRYSTQCLLNTDRFIIL